MIEKTGPAQGFWQYRKTASHIAVTLLLFVLGAYQASAAMQQSPEELVTQTTDQLLRAQQAELKAIEKDPAIAQKLVRKILLPVIDVTLVSRAVLGKYWHRASPEQRERFTKEFTEMLVRTYAAPLLTTTGVKVRYLSQDVSADGQYATVRTIVSQGDNQPVHVDYSLVKVNGEWKVYDVAVEGISSLITYRQEYYSVIQNMGLDKFLDKLAEKNRQASNQPPG
jgi:phospholipid transport system substrate-binding protein